MAVVRTLARPPAVPPARCHRATRARFDLPCPPQRVHASVSTTLIFNDDRQQNPRHGDGAARGVAVPADGRSLGALGSALPAAAVAPQPHLRGVAPGVSDPGAGLRRAGDADPQDAGGSRCQALEDRERRWPGRPRKPDAPDAWHHPDPRMGRPRVPRDRDAGRHVRVERKLFSSLSAAARKITGTQWNGPKFFGLRDGKAGGQ